MVEPNNKDGQPNFADDNNQENGAIVQNEKELNCQNCCEDGRVSAAKVICED